MPETLQQALGRRATAAIPCFHGCQVAGEDIGIAAMVEDELRVGAGLDQLRSVA